MDGELLPLGLAIKLIGALALCFGVLVAAAWFLRRRWPSLGRLGAPEQTRPGLTVVESRGLAPGTTLHLLEVEGTRILVMQTKDRGDVLWTRESGDTSFADMADEEEAPPQAPPMAVKRPLRPYERRISPAQASAARKAGADAAALPIRQAAREAAAPFAPPAVLAPQQALIEDHYAAPETISPPFVPEAQQARFGKSPLLPLSPEERARDLELHRERQRRYRERLREAAKYLEAPEKDLSPDTLP